MQTGCREGRAGGGGRDSCSLGPERGGVCRVEGNIWRVRKMYGESGAERGKN